MNEKSFIAQKLMGLLRQTRNPLVQNIKQGVKMAAPLIYDNASNYLDMVFDPQKAAMEYYAKQFNPSPKQIESLQDVKDFIGDFSSVPMAPPFLGRGQMDRGYLPVANLVNGSDTSGAWGMYDPYPEYAMKHNAGMRSYEQSQNENAKRPFDDWAQLHNAVLDRHQNTMTYQAGLRKDPKNIAAAHNDPERMASIIHQKTLQRNAKSQQIRPGDMLRGTLMMDNKALWNGMKPDNFKRHDLELPDMTGKQPFIIR